ncbi:PD-(D/E)XK motif protein [Spiribacter salilacus]|uniref:PD-(D/E)XK motif protein n=1 Tax=Spiribacter salilacus TaxID=2664894 RepID=UPI00129A2FDE|nr:PD-(D/E)XK motif protein [Spiribacter salilacus]
MIRNEAPWDEMKTPDSDYTVRYATALGDVTLCWGKDAEGHCLFILQLAGEHTEQFRKNSSDVNGIRVDLRQLAESGRQGLILTLERHVDRDLFHALCQTLIGNLKGVTDPPVALSVAFNHIKRWKAFLAGKRPRVLSAEEVRGLFAELSFLRRLRKKRLTDGQSVDAWCGPDRIHQDFIFGDTAVEVKSISGKDRSVVRVSSEDQLETVSDRLFLQVYRLTEAPDGAAAQSINQLAATVGDELSDADAIEAYWAKLATYGYVELREYDKPRFLINGSNTYRISDGFPKLVRSGLPEGVVDVKYNLQLERIASFECREEGVWES